jgi:hypothetical protein
LKVSDKYAPGNNVLVLPANLVAESANSAVLAAGAKTEDAKSLGNDDTLLLVVRGRDTLEDLEPLKSSSTAGSLVRDHSAHGLVEDARRSAEVEGTTTGRVVTGDLAEIGVVLDCCRKILCQPSAAQMNDLDKAARFPSAPFDIKDSHFLSVSLPFLPFSITK